MNLFLLDIAYSALLILVFVAIGYCLFYEKRVGVSPTPVLPWVRRRALNMALAHTDRNAAYNVADLGCGWGGLMTALVRKYPRAHVTGYEVSYPPYLASILRTFARRRLRVVRRDFMEQDLSAYDIVFCYLSHRHMLALRPKLAALKPGSIVVSCSFPIPEWTPTAQDTVKGIVPIPVFLYRVAG